jgi:hypothetical protein
VEAHRHVLVERGEDEKCDEDADGDHDAPCRWRAYWITFCEVETSRGRKTLQHRLRVDASPVWDPPRYGQSLRRTDQGDSRAGASTHRLNDISTLYWSGDRPLFSAGLKRHRWMAASSCVVALQRDDRPGYDCLSRP